MWNISGIAKWLASAPLIRIGANRMLEFWGSRIMRDWVAHELHPDQYSFKVDDNFEGNSVFSLQLKGLIQLDVQHLNKTASSYNLPVEFIDASFDSIYVYFHYSLSGCRVVVNSLRATVSVKERMDSAMLSSMVDAMFTSSHETIQEFMRQPECDVYTSGAANADEVLDNFTAILDTMMSKIEVDFNDTIIKVEHSNKDTNSGIGLVMNIDKIYYRDNSCSENKEEFVDCCDEINNGRASYSSKNIKLENVRFSTMEFSNETQTDNSGKEIDPETNEVYSKCRSDVDDEDSDDQDGSDQADINNETDEYNRPVAEQEELKRIHDSYYSGSGRHIVPFAFFVHTVEANLKMRLRGNSSPEVTDMTTDLHVGSVLVFLSPRQMHLLLELASELLKSDNKNDGVNSFGQNQRGGPMTSTHYAIIERDLMQNYVNRSNRPQSDGLKLNQSRGWSGPPLDDSDDDPEFQPMDSYHHDMSDSISLASSMSSSMTSAAQMNTYDKLTGRIDGDPNRERSSYQVHASSLTVVLLHEDVLVWDETLKISSVAQLQTEVEEFFSKTKDFFAFQDNEYFKMFPEVLNRACSRNHLRLLATPMQFEIERKTNAKYLSTEGRLEIAQISLSEYTKKSRDEPWKVSKLISFDDRIATATSSLCLAINHAKKLNPNSNFSYNQQKYPYTTLKFTLRPSTLDIDVTLLDRISNLLTPVYICSSPPSRSDRSCEQGDKLHVVIDIVSNALTVNLRFPQLEAQFFEKKVTHDFLQLVLSNVIFRTSWQAPGHYELQCKNIDVSYYENENSTPEHIAATDIGEKSSSTCRLSITTQTSTRYPENGNVHADPGLMQSVNIIADPPSSFDIGPFSCKRVVHESNVNAGHHNAEPNKELKMPGDTHEIGQFVDITTATSDLHFDIQLPTVSMQLISKHTYELLYNRIVNGLLMWEPKAPKLRTTSLDYSGSEDTFLSFHNGSDDEEGDNAEDDLNDCMQKLGLMSPTTMNKPKETKKKPGNGNDRRKNSNLTINFRIDQGLLCLHAPVRDSFSNVIPNQHGEFLVKVEKANLFFVSGYMGDQDLSYMSSEICSAKMYHCAQTTTTEGRIPTLRKVNCRPEEHLKSIIHPSNKEVLLNTGTHGGKREMITVAVKIEKNQCIHQNSESFKKFTISAGLNKITLRHRPVHSPNNWYSQLIDFFNVPDHPIPGYEYTRSITELYAYFWDSVVDHRPKYLKLRAMLTLGSFTVSCHLSSENVSTIVLRIIAEDCRFFLSDKGTHIGNRPFSFPANLERDYVNLIEMNLFEISVKLSKDKTPLTQLKDLRASTNMILVRVCYDSLSALSDFIMYFCNSGDLISSVDIESSGSSTYSSPSHQQDQELISLGSNKNRNNTCSKNSEKRIGDLLCDAIEDVEVQQHQKADRLGDQHSRNPNNYGATFMFPEEKDDRKQFPQVTTELGNIHHGSFECENDDLSEFVFVSRDIAPGPDPLAVMHKDYYEERADYLYPSADKMYAQEKYKCPLERYTLSEMSLHLFIYDGNDFASTTERKLAETTLTTTENSVRFSNKQPDRVTFTSKSGSSRAGKDDWMLIGGVNRRRDVHVAFRFSKVFYDNQIYHPGHAVASKQDIVIADMVVFDGVDASNVNGNMLHALSETPQESTTQFLKIQKVMERDTADNTHQLCMKVSGQDLKVDVDQITLLFLFRFFKNLSECTSTEIQPERRLSKQNTPVHQPPIMTVNDNERTNNVEENDLSDTDDLLILTDDRKVPVDLTKESDSQDGYAVEDGPVYIKQFIFDPPIKIKVYYKGRDIISPTDGFFKGVVMGLVKLDSSTIYLRSYQNDKGIKGFDNLWNTILEHWKDDLANQKFGIISGIPPLGTLVTLFSGVRDLIVMPIAQYRKDGRIMKGLHRGANSFTISTCTAALDLARNVFSAIQFTAEAALEIFAVAPVKEGRTPHRKDRKKRQQYPKDFRQGANNALATFTGGFQETFEHFKQVAVSKRDNRGYVSASATVLGKLPAFAAEGLAITFQAANDIVEGTHNQMHPDHKKEELAKWRTDEQEH